jgi:hypothetical protein
MRLKPLHPSTGRYAEKSLSDRIVLNVYRVVLAGAAERAYAASSELSRPHQLPLAERDFGALEYAGDLVANGAAMETDGAGQRACLSALRASFIHKDRVLQLGGLAHGPSTGSVSAVSSEPLRIELNEGW